MPKRMPIKAARDVGDAYGLSQVLLVGLDADGARAHVVTWGKTLEDCKLAADAGNNLKRIMGWPDRKCRSKPARARTAERGG